MIKLREHSSDELQQKILVNLRLLLDLRFQQKMGNKVKTHLFSKLKKEIAQSKTILEERGRDD